jgi:hypothetical protein
MEQWKVLFDTVTTKLEIRALLRCAWDISLIGPSAPNSFGGGKMNGRINIFRHLPTVNNNYMYEELQTV